MNIQYIRAGDYFVQDLKLLKEFRTIGKWNRLYREYLKEYNSVKYTPI